MKHRTLLLAATALSFVVVGSSAYAADLPRKAPVYAPVTPAPVYIWTGFYVGLNAGYGWASTDADVGSDLSGFVGGGQIGYNWQSGNWVFGVEGDFQGSAQDASDSGVVPGVGLVTVDQEIPWLATLRGRLGYAQGPWLFYVTGGAAWAKYNLSVTGPFAGSVEDHTTNFAWTVGGGVEWMFAPKWSAKLEYLYIDTGDTDVTLFGTPFTARAKDNIVRAGINYHF
jgi:outer membrane immunogenic protein